MPLENQVKTDDGKSDEPARPMSMTSGAIERGRSTASASGIWFATVLSIGFVLTQANGWAIDRPILVAIVFWVPVGVLIDLWSRSQRTIESFEVVQHHAKRTMMRLLYAMGVLVVVWTAFRPSTSAVSTAPWVAIVQSMLDQVEVALPGLRYSRKALELAGRPDIAAYFGAYLVCVAAAWVVGMAVTGKLLGVLPVTELGRGHMVQVLANAYPPTPRLKTYAWRLVYASHYWVVFAFAFFGPWAIWHQTVTGSRTGMTRFWENAITGVGAFLPALGVVLAMVPGCAYSALWMRTGLRGRHRANLRKVSDVEGNPPGGQKPSKQACRHPNRRRDLALRGYRTRGCGPPKRRAR